MISYIHHQRGHWSINYLDDFGSAEYDNNAWNSYYSLEQILKEVRAAESAEKASLPDTKMEFLGTWIDTEKMEIQVSQQRMDNLQTELDKWCEKRYMNMKELQSLIGKLNFITNCERGGRIFIARLIDELRGEKGKEDKKIITGNEKGHSVVARILAKIQWYIHPLATRLSQNRLLACYRCIVDWRRSTL